MVIKLSQFGVKSILDYSVESDLSSEEAQSKTVEGKADVVPEVPISTFYGDYCSSKFIPQTKRD